MNEETNNSDFRKISLNIDLKSCQSKSFLEKLRYKTVYDSKKKFEEEINELAKKIGVTTNALEKACQQRSILSTQNKKINHH